MGTIKLNKSQKLKPTNEINEEPEKEDYKLIDCTQPFVEDRSDEQYRTAKNRELEMLFE